MDKPGLPWDGEARIGFGPGGEPAAVRYGSVSMIQSEMPNRDDVSPALSGRLYLAARCGDRVVYLWRTAGPPWDWQGPYPAIAVEPDDRRVPFDGSAGNAVLVRSHGGALQQNWELIAPAAHGGGVLHFWRDNDPVFPFHPDWRVAPAFLRSAGTVDAVAMIESHLQVDSTGQRVYALEVVARVGGTLRHAFRGADLTWAGPFPLAADGVPVADAAGVPSLVQSRYGARKQNFELVTPRAGGGLLHLWRDDDDGDPTRWRWGHAAAVIDPTRQYEGVSLVERPNGDVPGTLEMAARTTAGRVLYFWRDPLDLRWQGPYPILTDS